MLPLENGHAGATAGPMPLLEVARTTVLDQLERRPYTTVLVAAAAGYVLGGGIPWWAVRTVARVGGRVLVARAVAAIVQD